MEWELFLLLLMAAPFIAYYLVRDRIQGLKRRIAARTRP